MNNRLNEDIDEKITNCLKNKSNEISASDDMFFKIKAEILKENKGVFYNMKLRFLKRRTFRVACLVCILTTVTCVAVAATSGLYSVSTTNRNNAIKSFPSSDTVKNTVGFLPKYAESFNGGFKFYEFNCSDDSLKNDNGDAINKTKSAYFGYKRDGAKKNQYLDMDAIQIDEAEFNNKMKEINDTTEYDGVKIYYKSVQRKIVPVKYEKTEEDTKLINEGLLEMSFGSNEIEEHENQSVEWYENGIDYCIINSDYNDVDKNAMIEMAKTVIDR